MRRDIRLHHLDYTIKVRRLDPRKNKHIAYVEYPAANCATIYFRKNPDATVIAHELVHVLRHICTTYNMIFEDEREHMAYIMQYAMCEITGKRLSYKASRNVY